MIFKNKNISGIIYNGKNYSQIEKQMITTYDYSANQKIEPSASSEYTSGYLVTFTFSDQPFKLYRIDDLKTPLKNLPQHKFIYNNVTKKLLSGLTLTYNGDETFSLSGTIELPDAYSSSKYGAEVSIALVDEDDNFFISDIAIFSTSTSSSATTITFTGNTSTFQTYKGQISRFEAIPGNGEVVPNYQLTYGNFYGTSSLSSGVSFVISKRIIT